MKKLEVIALTCATDILCHGKKSEIIYYLHHSALSLPSSHLMWHKTLKNIDDQLVIIRTVQKS